MEDRLSPNSSVDESNFGDHSLATSSDSFEDLNSFESQHISDRELRYLRRNHIRILNASNPATLSEHSEDSDTSEEVPVKQMTTTYNFDLFTPWDAKFLDPTDSTLNKLLMKERFFENKKEKYNLEPKLLESYRLLLQAKSERCSLKSILFFNS